MLEEKIDALVAALDRLNATMSASSSVPSAEAPAKGKPGPKPKPAQVAAPAPAAAPAAATNGAAPTIDTLRESLRALLNDKGQNAVIAALGKVGATKLSSVAATDYPRLNAEIAALNAPAPAGSALFD